MKQYKKFFTGPRKLLLALSVLLCVWFGTAYGASAAGGDYTENEISMDVVCGYDGHVKGGRYLPVQVILTNGQETDSAGALRPWQKGKNPWPLAKNPLPVVQAM